MSKTKDTIKNFELNSKNLALLQDKTRIYTYLSGRLDKAYFKLMNGKFLFALYSNDGLMITTLDIDYEGDTEYFSAEWSKWNLALQKFIYSKSLKLSLNKNLLKISVDGSYNVVTLSVVNYDSDSIVAKQLDEFIPTKKTEIIGCNHKLELTPEVVSDFELMNSLFSTQNKINSIGISKTDVIYADRSVVVKANLEEPLSDSLFANINPEDDHIYIHSFILKLIEYLKDFNTTVYFDNEYEVLYWTDDNTEIIIYSDVKTINLPNKEQFEGIQPQNKDVFIDVPADKLVKGIDFFTGFFDGSSWKPIKFILKKDEDVLLYYKNPISETKCNINGVVSKYNGEFILESETLRKIVQKIRDRYNDDNVLVRFVFDPEGTETPAPGIYGVSGNVYEFIISKLSED